MARNQDKAAIPTSKALVVTEADPDGFRALRPTALAYEEKPVCLICRVAGDTLVLHFPASSPCGWVRHRSPLSPVRTRGAYRGGWFSTTAGAGTALLARAGTCRRLRPGRLGRVPPQHRAWRSARSSACPPRA